MAGRYVPAKQFKRCNRKLRSHLIRDIQRKLENRPELQAAFAPSLSKAIRIRHQKQQQRGPKLYFWHAPEVVCIGPFYKLRRQGSQALRVRLQGL